MARASLARPEKDRLHGINSLKIPRISSERYSLLPHRPRHGKRPPTKVDGLFYGTSQHYRSHFCPKLDRSPVQQFPDRPPGWRPPYLFPLPFKDPEDRAAKGRRNREKGKGKIPNAFASGIFGGATQTRTGGKGFADLCLTTWLWRRLQITGANYLLLLSSVSGAGDEARTRYLHLGKVALYQMSYTCASQYSICRSAVPDDDLSGPGG